MQHDLLSASNPALTETPELFRAIELTKNH
jgi:hypothetical protein